MSYLRTISFNCIAVVLASQLYTVPVTAGSIAVGTKGIVVVGAKSQQVHHRNKIRIHKHYIAPKAYAPNIYHAKPVPKHAPYAKRNLKKRSYRYLYAPWYGSKSQRNHRRSFRHGY